MALCAKMLAAKTDSWEWHCWKREWISSSRFLSCCTCYSSATPTSHRQTNKSVKVTLKRRHKGTPFPGRRHLTVQLSPFHGSVFAPPTCSLLWYDLFFPCSLSLGLPQFLTQQPHTYYLCPLDNRALDFYGYCSAWSSSWDATGIQNCLLNGGR